MTTVSALVPGDRVELTGAGATYVESAAHPLYPGLRLVIWRLDGGAWSHDALSADQDVGTVVPSTTRERVERLRAALHYRGGEQRRA